MTIESILAQTAKMTAEELEDLIHAIAQRRQEIMPEVPRNAPKYMALIDEPDVRMKITADGRLYFAVRSAGLGWLDIHFGRATSHSTIVACVGAAREIKDDATVFSPPRGNA